MIDPTHNSSQDPSQRPDSSFAEDNASALDNPYLAPSSELLTPAQTMGSSGLLIGIFVLVTIAVTFAIPGLGILMAIMAVPPLVRTLLVTHKRIQQNRAVSATDRVLLFAGSFGVTLVVSFVVLISSLATFCFVCISAENPKFIPIALLVSVVTVTLFCLFVFWIRARWRRDTQVKNPPEGLK
jgi:hypothetical protein